MGFRPRYRSPGELLHSRSLDVRCAPSGGGDGVRFQHHAHAPAQKIQQDRDAVLVIHAVEKAQARDEHAVQHLIAAPRISFGASKRK